MIERKMGKSWYFDISLFARWKEICIKPFHLCLDFECNVYSFSIGLLFFRFAVNLSKWDDRWNEE